MVCAELWYPPFHGSAFLCSLSPQFKLQPGAQGRSSLFSARILYPHFGLFSPGQMWVQLFPPGPTGLGVANPAVKQGHKPFSGTRCHFWRMWSSKAVSHPQSWVSLVVLSSNPQRELQIIQRKGPGQTASSGAHSCEQMPPVGAEASSSSP